LAEFGRRFFVPSGWRHVDSRIEEQLPLFRAQRVSSSLGLVQGKTQTWLPWPDIPRNETTAQLWFHDVLKSDGSPYSEEEMVRGKRRRIRPKSSSGDFTVPYAILASEITGPLLRTGFH
jgi:hypothetical protein